MKVKDLICLLSECNGELDVVTPEYQDVISLKEVKILTIRNESKNSTHQVVLGFDDEF